MADAATPATAALVDLYTTVADESPVIALAALAAYEVQASEIAASKADGLRVRYDVTDEGTRFWDVHSGADELHGAWTCDALAAIAVDADEVRRAPPRLPRRGGPSSTSARRLLPSRCLLISADRGGTTDRCGRH